MSTGSRPGSARTRRVAAHAPRVPRDHPDALPAALVGAPQHRQRPDPRRLRDAVQRRRTLPLETHKCISFFNSTEAEHSTSLLA